MLTEVAAVPGAIGYADVPAAKAAAARDQQVGVVQLDRAGRAAGRRVHPCVTKDGLLDPLCTRPDI
ncbi:hypothetical protein ACWEF6_21895 [Amycolatopsis sp. NPDC004772]